MPVLKIVVKIGNVVVFTNLWVTCPMLF